MRRFIALIKKKKFPEKIPIALIAIQIAADTPFPVTTIPSY